MPYPEGYQPNSAPGQTLPFSEITNFEYELGRPYIQSHGLSFSYGAMKGRATNWAAQLASKPLAASVIGVTAAGFPGLTLDADGYPGEVPAVVATLRRLLGVGPRYSADHTFLFYDLRPYARRLRAGHTAAQLSALRAATLYPLRLSCSTGRLTIVNPSSATQRAVLAAGVTGGGGAGALRLSVGGQASDARGRRPAAGAAGAGAGDDDGVGVRARRRGVRGAPADRADRHRGRVCALPARRVRRSADRDRRTAVPLGAGRLNVIQPRRGSAG